ncbi:hypothetical protein VNO78_25771 [Psophocarpus tetragonolobus]|uniref:glutathione transferase n=1 Tax=Psophocarpus tetragonolobus TaxID=3891 RepID=A0AAN9XFM7_PSOTE
MAENQKEEVKLLGVVGRPFVYRKVPVLVHKGQPIIDSLVILEYIDDTWKQNQPILPQEPYARALARFWAKFIDENCLSAVWKSASTFDAKERDKAIEESQEVLHILENELKGKFFGGEAFGFVDIVGTFIAFWLTAIEKLVGL